MLTFQQIYGSSPKELESYKGVNSESLTAAIENIYFSRRHTQTYADNKDFLPGRLAQAKASNAFQA